NLSDNDIDQLATDFSGLTSATTINLDGNKLDFGDLEPVAGVGALTFENQQNITAINEIGPIEIPAGSNQTLTTTVNGTANSYQWVLNGTDVTGETATSININSINRSNLGTYELKVSNSVATGVTLTSDPIDVLATAIISVNAVDIDNDQNITENVNAYLFELKEGEATDTLDFATQSDVNSAIIFPAVVLGDFIVAVESIVPLTNEDGTDNTDAQYIPTYFGDTFESSLADTLELNDDIQIQIIMTEVPPERNATTGSGVVSGTIEDDFEEDGARIDARRRAARRKCGLKKRRSGGRPEQDDSEFELIAYGETNDQGEFEYGFLPEGTYRFFVEYPGIPLDESSFVQFDIGEAGVSDDSFVLAVFASPEGIEIELVLGITSEFFTDFSIYPNPTTDILTIEYDKILGDELQMQIIDLNGKTFMSRSIPKNQNKVQVNTSTLSSGQYLIKFVDEKNKDNTLIYRLIKK
ncbi:MAG: T9SS type A sorting domain-containing protein, partial [Bacteroidota bacterium]